LLACITATTTSAATAAAARHSTSAKEQERSGDMGFCGVCGRGSDRAALHLCEPETLRRGRCTLKGSKASAVLGSRGPWKPGPRRGRPDLTTHQPKE
jgi:hypothetical protein